MAVAKTTSAALAAASGAAWHDMPVAELQVAMQSGRLTSRALTAHFLERIRAIDKRGPRLNAVIELNPEAPAIAAALDKERRKDGARGPLHGIPVLLKDNIATADRMSTSAGSLALAKVPVPRDAFLVVRLREAGAVILGKTNLSEWANFRSTRSTSGWSSRGGLTKNPHALDRNTSGSSSGSGSAMAAGLAALAVGTETDGSIVSPSSINGIVGIKPTVGLVSRNGIVPISHSQDTAGPMARSVADAAVLLFAMAGVDARDAATQASAGKGADYTTFLDAKGLQGARIGVARNYFGGSDLVRGVIETALTAMREQGATLIDVEMPAPAKYRDAEFEILLFEFKADLNAYLAEFAAGAEARTLADLIAWNKRHEKKVMPFFGQEHFESAEAKGTLEDPAYRAALETIQKVVREGIDKLLAEQKLDALVAPTAGTGWLTDFVNGDSATGGFSSPAATAGYPHVTVPAGFVHGLPVGVSFVGGPWSEGALIKLAYAYEQATHKRRAPKFARSIGWPEGA